MTTLESTENEINFPQTSVFINLVDKKFNSWKILQVKKILQDSYKNINSCKILGCNSMVNCATVGNLEFPDALLKGDSYWYRVLRVRAVVVSLAELLWIKRPIISLRAEILARNDSRLALILSSTKSGENLKLFSSFFFHLRLLLLLQLLLTRRLTFLVARLDRTSSHFLISLICRKSSFNWQEVYYDLNRYISSKLMDYLKFSKAKLKIDAKQCTGWVQINQPGNFWWRSIACKISEMVTVYRRKYWSSPNYLSHFWFVRINTNFTG